MGRGGERDLLNLKEIDSNYIFWRENSLNVTQGLAACEGQKLTPSHLDIYNLDTDWLK